MWREESIARGHPHDNEVDMRERASLDICWWRGCHRQHNGRPHPVPATVWSILREIPVRRRPGPLEVAFCDRHLARIVQIARLPVNARAFVIYHDGPLDGQVDFLPVLVQGQHPDAVAIGGGAYEATGSREGETFMYWRGGPGPDEATIERERERIRLGERPMFRAETEPDGRFLFIRVPELGVATQAESRDKIEEMVRDLISLWLEVSPDTFDIQVVETPR